MDTIAKRNIRAASSHRSTLILLAAASLAWLGGGNALQAQSVTAILVGTISDQSGAAVPTNPSSYLSSVRPMPGGLAAPAFSAAGGRDNSNGYLVDGVDAIDPIYLSPSMFPPMDSIQEFKVQTSSYSAEFGHFGVQVNASTRGGTNQLHGSLYEYFRNDGLDAANFFDNFAGLRKAPLRYNLFGRTLGGPVVVP